VDKIVLLSGDGVDNEGLSAARVPECDKGDVSFEQLDLGINP